MSVTAKVKVVLEIRASGSWGDDCTVAQVKKQAIDSADTKIRLALEKAENGIRVLSKVECVSIQYDPKS